MNYTDLIAMQVLTHNNPKIVKDVLEHCLDYYKRYGVEIYYYDSSDNEDTKVIIDDFIAKGYDNLIYVKMTGMVLPQKLDMCFRGYGLRKDYKYLWPTKDRAYVTESALEDILNTVRETYDAVLLASREGDKSLIESAEELYSRWAPITTSINTVIYNRETLLKKAVYHEYDDQYPEYLKAFGHIFLLFDGMSRIDKPKVARIDMANRIIVSPYGESSWTTNVFHIWKGLWIDVNDALPSIYDPYKDYIIKKVASLPWILADRNRLVELHEKGVLTPETLPQALDRWERISDIPKEVVMAIANDAYDIKYDLTQVQDRNDLTKLMVEMAGYIRDSKMTRDQIPIDDLSTAIKIELVKDEDKPRRNIRIGAVESIIDSMKNTDGDAVEIVLMFQQLIAYII